MSDDLRAGEYALTLGANTYDVTANGANAMFAAPKVRATGKLSVHDLWNENIVAFTDGEDAQIDDVADA